MGPSPEGGPRGWHGKHHGGFGGGSMQERIDRFKAIDKNADGFIDKAELQASREEETAFRVKRMLHHLDTDKDGRITKEEFLAPARQHFARMDLNGDGKITADDLPPGMRPRWGR
jgi:Ca2+-binding EF-hand superfamily protein